MRKFALMMLAANLAIFVAVSGAQEKERPAVREAPPRAALVGLFEPSASPVAGTADTVIGRVMLDASASRSDRPIRWKWSGPTCILVVQPSGDGPPNSIAIAYLGASGTYHFQAVARGWTEGERDADAAAFTFTIGAKPSTPGPAPGPSPAPGPGPRPFPSTSLQRPPRA